jgi:SAM-dependent methyltransferase
MPEDETLKTYNFSAKELASYFHTIGSRVKYIEAALEMAYKMDGNADVLELGCGDGWDADDILQRVESYVGLDYSRELIKLARQRLPAADFRVVDVQNYDYPEQAYDVVFAFDLIIHIDKESLNLLMQKVARSLKVGGIFYISTKHGDQYKKEWVEDKYGRRLFYYYNEATIMECAGKNFELASSDLQFRGNTKWLHIALRKA